KPQANRNYYPGTLLVAVRLALQKPQANRNLEGIKEDTLDRLALQKPQANRNKGIVDARLPYKRF
ncbi:MAG: hypothetical protein KDK12_16230, partial [Rhodobacteraceae bacterium]|nr:hypothetical protein [Paracoccaceae bacterium]